MNLLPLTPRFWDQKCALLYFVCFFVFNVAIAGIGAVGKANYQRVDNDTMDIREYFSYMERFKIIEHYCGTRTCVPLHVYRYIS